MKPAPFVYHRPTSAAEALSILAEVASEDGRVLAGGQSLAPMMAFRIATPTHLVDINRVPEFARLAVDDATISISACVRHAAFETIDAPGPIGALLRRVASHVAHHPIRVRGTFCGSLAHADPASEWCLLAVVRDATLVAQSASDRREIPADSFFQGVMTTALEPDEILVEARVPTLPSDARASFLEFSRRAGDFAIASVLTTCRLVEGVLRDVRLAVGGAEASPRRLHDAEAAIEGRAPSEALIREAAEIAARVIDPLEDQANDAAFRRDLVRALSRRALTEAIL